MPLCNLGKVGVPFLLYSIFCSTNSDQWQMGMGDGVGQLWLLCFHFAGCTQQYRRALREFMRLCGQSFGSQGHCHRHPNTKLTFAIIQKCTDQAHRCRLQDRSRDTDIPESTHCPLNTLATGYCLERSPIVRTEWNSPGPPSNADHCFSLYFLKLAL